MDGFQDHLQVIVQHCADDRNGNFLDYFFLITIPFSLHFSKRDIEKDPRFRFDTPPL